MFDKGGWRVGNQCSRAACSVLRNSEEMKVLRLVCGTRDGENKVH